MGFFFAASYLASKGAVMGLGSTTRENSRRVAFIDLIFTRVDALALSLCAILNFLVQGETSLIKIEEHDQRLPIFDHPIVSRTPTPFLSLPSCIEMHSRQRTNGYANAKRSPTVYLYLSRILPPPLALCFRSSVSSSSPISGVKICQREKKREQGQGNE